MSKPSRTLQQLNRDLEGVIKAGVTAQQINARRCAFCGEASSKERGVVKLFGTWIMHLIHRGAVAFKEPTSSYLHDPCVVKIKRLINK